MLCCSVRSFALHTKSPRSRAASGSSLQRAPRPAPCEVGLVRAKAGYRAEKKGPEKKPALATRQRRPLAGFMPCMKRDRGASRETPREGRATLTFGQECAAVRRRLYGNEAAEKPRSGARIAKGQTIFRRFTIAQRSESTALGSLAGAPNCARRGPRRRGGVAGNSPLEWGAGDAAPPAWGKSFPHVVINLR